MAINSDNSKILGSIKLRNVGPTDNLEASYASRLNIITGDNGIGKTFLMDCSWWAVTNTWTDNVALPKRIKSDEEAYIHYSLKQCNAEIAYNRKENIWERTSNAKTMNGVALFSLVDNTYAVWDSDDKENTYSATIFTNNEIWHGNDKLDGLIFDWLKWQNNPEKYPFEAFANVLKAMSPPDMGILRPGEPIMTSTENKMMPTIIFPYGTVPVTYASAGIKRIITLAYLIVWAWSRHIDLCKEQKLTPVADMMIMIDEIEAHIHPKWQRTILMALMEIQKSLSEYMNIQFIISTHSPLILASAEAVFDKDEDKLFKIRLTDDKKDAIIQEEDFIKYGQINEWLTSPIFNLTQARSVEAEKAIENAKRLQLEDEPNPEEIKLAHENLLKFLSQTDIFWPRWIYFAEQNGVKV